MAGMFEKDLVLKIADVGDSIFIAESEKTPFSRLLPRGKKPVNMLCEWPVSRYPATGFAGTYDGTDKATFSKTDRDKLRNYGMWMVSPGWMVSKLAELVESTGVKQEKAFQGAADGIILAQMIERQLLSADAAQDQAEPSTPYGSRGVFDWLKSGAQAVLPVPANYRPSSGNNYAGTLAAFTPALFEAQLQSMATEKKGPVDLTGIVGIALKSRMSKWAQKVEGLVSGEAAIQQFNINATEKKLQQVVDFFEFDAGTVKTIPSWYLRCDATTGEATAYTTRSGVLVDLSMWKLRFYQTPMAWEEPRKSGGPRGYHDSVYTLECGNPKGQGMIEISADA